ncbi:MAG TPA: ABC transporter ATP-binding protein [Clostridia bacterium]|nr:ABC transporter ATP-binding protein [Clostridia bacterium]
MRGNARFIALSALFLALAVVAAYCTPLVISFTVDYAIGGKGSNLPASIMRVIENLGGREFVSNNLWVCALAVLAFSAVNGASTYLRRRYIAEASEGLALTMRNELYDHLQQVPYDYHKHASTGDLIQRCTSDVDTVRRFVVNQLMEAVRTVFMVGAACAILFSLNVTMALISIALLPVLATLSLLYFRFVKKQFQLSDEAEGQLSSTLQENLTGVRVVRAFGQEKSELDKFTACNADFRDKTYKLIRMFGLYFGSSDMIGYTQIAITIFVSIVFCVRGIFTLGDMIIFSSYVGMLIWPIRQLGRVLADFGKATVSMGRIEEILKVPAETEPGRALKPAMRGEIEFRNVCFGYDAYDDVLSDISFTAKPGQTVAILGSTGSGKTSLVQLLQRLYLCTAGEIVVDGVNVNDIERGYLRSHIGIVLQEPFLYSRTIMDNISIVRPGVEPEEVYSAAKIASVHDVINKFEAGYDTIVGERGVTLSGGQKQRVAIARMLMQNAPILIFDDSMSAVDTETDAAIRNALRERRKDITTFIISHRITTLCEADKILVLEHGKLVQEGTHAELVTQDGLYRRIARIQNALEEDLAQELGERRGENNE